MCNLNSWNHAVAQVFSKTIVCSIKETVGNSHSKNHIVNDTCVSLEHSLTKHSLALEYWLEGNAGDYGNYGMVDV